MTADKLHRPTSKHSAELTARLKEALMYHQRGDCSRAEALYRQVLEMAPDSFDATHLLGVALTQRGAFDKGIACLGRAIALDPTQINARFSLARALLDKSDAAALAACVVLVDMQPENADAWFLRGNSLQQSGRHSEAVESYKLTLRFRPDFPAALNNLGHSLRVLRRTEESLDALARALKLQPAYTLALNNQGLALLDAERATDALRSFARALQLKPDVPEILSNQATAFNALKRYDEAAQSFARLVAVAPRFGGAAGGLLFARRQSCDWTDTESLTQTVIAAVQRGEFVDLPLSFLCTADDRTAQLACARTFSATRFPSQPRPRSTGWPSAHDRIRIAYLSGDFGDHALSYLLAGVIERHDRKRFDTVAVAWGHRGEAGMRERLETSFDRFIDADDMSDTDVAHRLRELEVDIAVDLTGHTGTQRSDIFARRAAPIQVNYLGLPATMGMPEIDYIVADAFVIPVDCQDDYSEQVVYLPECFQANDGHRVVDANIPTRVQMGLPESAFVWCSFHGHYKFNPGLFDIWMRLVLQLPGSVLWLVGGNALVEENLRREARARGLESDRLIFAGQLPYALHLARLPLADLCLDTLPFNGGATTSDALWAGVPMVTCAGNSFAARMSGSLLRTVGLPELVTPCLHDYETLASRLSRDPQSLAALRSRLAHGKLSSSLFDTARLTRHLEAAYTAMVERHMQGEPPAMIRLAPLPPRSPVLRQ